MSWRTVLILLLVVAGLAFYALRTEEHIDTALAEQDVALFPGLDANLVVGLRIENVARDQHMHFRREPSGGWRLTDPIDARAETSPLDLLVEGAARSRGPVVPQEEARDLSRLGLDPPRFVLDVETESNGREARLHAEFGAVDLDKTHMFVRVEGRVLRVSRELEATLDMQLFELRASNVSAVDAREVLEVHRRGSISKPAVGPGMDVDFDAVQEHGAWRATAPVEGALDPRLMALYTRSAVNYRYEKLIDEGSRALQAFGLDPPELTLRFGTVGTEEIELIFGRTGAARVGGWVGTRVGSSLVWPLSTEDIEFFATPLEDLLDHLLVRARRGGIQRIEIGTSRAEIRLVRQYKGWACSTASPGSTVFGPEEPAEARVVEDLLGALESYELAGFLRGARFDAGPSAVRWRIASEEGETGGTFGAEYTDANGAVDVLFQRTGETAVAHGSPAILAVLSREPEQYLSLLVLQTNEVDITRVELRGSAGEAVFERNAKGIWVQPGGDVEARELYGVLDGLLFLRASERISESEKAPLEGGIEVRFAGPGAPREPFTIGTTTASGAPRAEVEYHGHRAVLQDAHLIEKLTDLARGTRAPTPR